MPICFTFKFTDERLQPTEIFGCTYTPMHVRARDDKAQVVRSSYLHNGDSYTGKRAFYTDQSQGILMFNNGQVLDIQWSASEGYICLDNNSSNICIYKPYVSVLTHWWLNKIGSIFRQHLQICFQEWKLYVFPNVIEVRSWDPADFKSVLVQVIAWRWAGNNPLTHLPLNKMPPFRRQYLQMHFRKWKVFVLKGPIDNNPALVYR